MHPRYALPLRLATNALLLLLSLLGLFGLGEAGVRHLQSSGRLPDYAQPAAPSAQQQGIAANLVPLRRVDDPRLYVEFDPADPRVNRYGFRGPEPALAKAPGSLRIAVIGDSVAFGYGLPREDAFPYRLEHSLQAQGIRAEVLNLAVSGYGIEAYAALYETKVRQFAPDLVVLAYVLNDPVPPEAMFQAIGSLMQQQARLRRLAQTSQFAAWALSTGQQAASAVLAHVQNRIIYQSDDTRRLLQQQFLRLRDMARADNTELAVFVFPYFSDFTDYDMRPAHAMAGETLDAAGLRWHDLLADYAGSDARSLRLAPDDVTHPNAQGQQLAATAIERALRAWGLLPPAVH